MHHGVETAIGDRAAADEREPARARTTPDDPVLLVPDDPRAKLAELLRGVLAAEHPEQRVEVRSRQVGEARRAADDCVEVVDRPFVDARHGDDLLRKHVERVLGDADRLDVGLLHALRHGRRLEEVAAPLGDDPADGGLTDEVPRATDPL